MRSRGLVKRSTRPVLFVVALSCALAACMVERAPGLWATEVTYLLRFDRSGVEPLDVGFGTTTSDGVQVRLRRGYLLQSSMTLVDCLGVGGDVWDEMASRLAPTLLRGPLFGASVARAGHGDAGDPSEVIAPRFVDLAESDADIVFGRVTIDETRYCRVHQLVAGSYDAASIEGHIPDDIDPVLTTLVIEGEVLRDGLWAPFEARSTVSSGALYDLPDVVEGDLGGGEVTVVLERDLARTFDGVDFDDEPERQVLRNLVVDAPVIVRVGSEDER